MPHTRFELDVWKQVARQPDVAAVLETVLPQLLGLLPFGELALWHFELERLHGDMLARFVHAKRTLPGPPRPLAAQQLRELAAWCREGSLLQAGGRSQLPPPLPHLGSELRRPLAAIPLGGADEAPCGALVLSGLRTRSDDVCQAVARILRPALTAALANHVRLQGLTRVAEAGRADRMALLTRLDRQDISESVIGAETGLLEVVEQVRQVAPTDAPVLIFGETGAGKEVVARQVHSLSPRASGPIVRVNCGAIPPELIDSELFGHERGSFTGAVAARKGWFERADGGTLFLDEIGELPLAAQVRVLHVLQDGLIERVGAEQSSRVDVRIIGATHRNLEQMVRQGGFREDLWYRIGVFPIRLPPLRERREDIPALASHFARRATRRLGGLPLSLTPDDIALLVSYDWPGNIRELAAVIERAAILGNGRRLEVGTALGISRASAAAVSRGAPGQATGRELEAALQNCRGRIEGPFGAAQVLGLNPNTLRSRLRKLGLDPRRYRKAAGSPG